MMLFTPTLEESEESGNQAITHATVPIGECMALCLDADGYARADARDDDGLSGNEPVVLIRHAWDDGGSDCVAALVNTDACVRVNGLPAAPLHVLRDRDEISLAPGRDEARVYFSTQTPAAIIPFQEDGKAWFCGLSKMRLKQGDPVVWCDCGMPFLQSEDVPAYTYASECSNCHRPTKLGLNWKPDPIPIFEPFDLERYRAMVETRGVPTSSEATNSEAARS